MTRIGYIKCSSIHRIIFTQSARVYYFGTYTDRATAEYISSGHANTETNSYFIVFECLIFRCSFLCFSIVGTAVPYGFRPVSVVWYWWRETYNTRISVRAHIWPDAWSSSPSPLPVSACNYYTMFNKNNTDLDT